MNKLQSALQQLDIEQPQIVDNNLINYLHLYPNIISPVACLNNMNSMDKGMSNLQELDMRCNQV